MWVELTITQKSPNIKVVYSSVKSQQTPKLHILDHRNSPQLLKFKNISEKSTQFASACKTLLLYSLTPPRAPLHDNHKQLPTTTATARSSFASSPFSASLHLHVSLTLKPSLGPLYSQSFSLFFLSRQNLHARVKM